MLTHSNPPPPPAKKYKTIKCLGCGANHDQHKCPYCGTERKNCDCGLVTILMIKGTDRFFCGECGQEIIPQPCGSADIDTNDKGKWVMRLKWSPQEGLTRDICDCEKPQTSVSGNFCHKCKKFTY